MLAKRSGDYRGSLIYVLGDIYTEEEKAAVMDGNTIRIVNYTKKV
jgi:hypothetical protein